MILILAHPEDLSAIRLHGALRSRVGPAGVRIVSVEEVALSPRWIHRAGAAGAGGSSVTLADGTVIDDRALDLVIQRVRAVGAPHFAGAQPCDRDYAATELQALVLSWLQSLACPVVNPPAATMLGMRSRGLLEWMVLAARAGLATPTVHVATSARRLRHADWRPASRTLGREPVVAIEPRPTGHRRVVVAGERVVGDAPPEVARACVRLARSTGCSLLEIQLGTSGGSWRFQRADEQVTIPDTATANAIAAAWLDGSRRLVASA